MKKISLLCLDSDQARALTTLQDMGLVHVEHLQPPEGSAVIVSRTRRTTVADAQLLLKSWGAPTARPTPALASERLVEKMERVHPLDAEYRELLAQIDATRIEVDKWKPFGHFDLNQIQALAHTGIRVRLLWIPGKKKPVFPASVSAVLLSQTADDFFAAVAALDDSSIEGIEYPLPTRPLKDIEAQLALLHQRKTALESEFHELASLLPQLDHLLLELEDQLLFENARAGMKTEGRVVCLKGYCPEDAVAPLSQAAAANGWAILVETPLPDDPVPTLVRNPAWIRPIRFMFSLIGVVPGYQEVDISAAFLGFLSLFFAMLVGDAGYGALFLIITLILRFTAKTVPKDLIRLLMILSVSTIIWGALSGNYFGMLHLPAPLAALRVAWLSDEQNVMQLCFLIGACHLTLAHLWNLIRYLPKPIFLAQLGWIGLTWSLYFLAGNMILDKVLPGFFTPLLIGSLVLVILFMTPIRAMKTEWFNHVMLPLSIIGGFGDIVSYVRLFAVGSAGAAISMAFNQMAVGDGIHSFGAGLMAALILFLAHSLNIMLCALAVIVHGVRLNTLEFSGHLGMQWTGAPYAPLARKSTAKLESGSVPT